MTDPIAILCGWLFGAAAGLFLSLLLLIAGVPPFAAIIASPLACALSGVILAHVLTRPSV